MSALGNLGTTLQAQFRDNPRLRLGGLLILGLVVLYLFLVLSDARRALEADVAGQAERLAKLQALAGQDVWLARAQAAAALRQSLQAEIPEARTAGLAQAAMQSQLRTLLSEYGDLVQIEVEAASPVDGHPDLLRVPATVTSAGIDIDRIKRILQAIESQPVLLAVRSATVRNRDQTRLALNIDGYFRLAPAQEANDAP